MDWPLAITRNRDALQRIVAALFAMLAAAASTSPTSGRGGPQDRRGPVCLPRHIYAAILLILRPAESALRRLILIAAMGLALKPRPPRLAPQGLPAFSASATKTPAFCLLDPLKVFTREDFDTNAVPRFGFDSVHDHEFDMSPLAQPDLPIDATQLFARLRALRSALSDLPRQARRLARFQARRDAALKSLMLRCERSEPRSTHAWRPMRLSIFRPGLPPGWRQRPIHEIDDVLRECHGLALHAINGPDTG
ncbi:MAG: hypothetical protein WCC66_10280 [Rhizobiaceae bacterium]